MSKLKDAIIATGGAESAFRALTWIRARKAACKMGTKAQAQNGGTLYLIIFLRAASRFVARRLVFQIIVSRFEAQRALRPATWMKTGYPQFPHTCVCARAYSSPSLNFLYAQEKHTTRPYKVLRSSILAVHYIPGKSQEVSLMMRHRIAWYSIFPWSLDRIYVFHSVLLASNFRSFFLERACSHFSSSHIPTRGILFLRAFARSTISIWFPLWWYLTIWSVQKWGIQSVHGRRMLSCQ